MARKLAAGHGLGDDDLIVSRADLEELQSRLYCLQAALEDVDRDLAVSDGPDDVREALGWVCENARPVASMWIEPRSTEPGPTNAKLDITRLIGGTGDPDRVAATRLRTGRSCPCAPAR
jgi:hypothetical protein